MHCDSKRVACITFDNKVDLIYILLRDSELDKGEIFKATVQLLDECHNVRMTLSRLFVSALRMACSMRNCQK